MTNRAAGEGTVVQRRDGRWQASLQVEGKRHTVYGRTRQEAARKLADLQRLATSTGTLPHAGRRTLADLLDYYLASIATSLRPRTYADYQQTAQLYLIPLLGDTLLSKLTPTRIQAAYRALQERGLSRAPSKAHRLLYRVLELGVYDWGWLASNPCNRVLSPKYSPQRKTLWDATQLDTFLVGASAHRFYPLWLLLIATGVRIGEALALQWADVSSDAITVSKTLARIGGAWIIGAPKTRSGARVVTLPPRVGVILAALRGGCAPDALVFPSTHGAPLGASLVEHALHQECAS